MNHNTKRKNKVVPGGVYAELTVIRKTDKRTNGMVMWECTCSCGNKHYASTSNLKSGRVKSCGCFVSDRTKAAGKKFGRLTAIRRVKRRGSERNYWECVCDCGNETTVSTSDLNNGRTKSCGCLRSELVTGVGSKFYNPNLTAEERIASNRFLSSEKNIRIWRNEVYEKDNFTCQKCGTRGGDMNAHHLDGWHWCEERRFEVTNGATLCVSCHKEFHYKHGSKWNTKEQFEEYIS